MTKLVGNGAWVVREGDCSHVLQSLPSGSVDACVTDPPYGLGFMGCEWDKGVPGPEIWAEVLRVLKPGGHLLAFFGTRTYHRGAVAIEDAGFEIRDQIGWAYGTGFPKSLNVSKAIESGGGRPEDIRRMQQRDSYRPSGRGRSNYDHGSASAMDGSAVDWSPTTDAARQWEGWGTALKPAYEPVLIGSKPLTVRQFFGVIIQETQEDLAAWLNVSAKDAAVFSSDIQAKWREEARSVLEPARMRALASIENVSFAEAISICPPLACEDPKRMQENSAHKPARESGSPKTRLARETQTGREGASSSALTDIITCLLTGATSESIVTSWNRFSEELYTETSTFTISTVIRLITDLKTLRSLLLPITSGDTGSFSPNWNSVVVARKPLVGTVAANVTTHGTGALNIDGCRVETADDLNGGAYSGPKRQREEYTNTDTAPGAKPLSRLNRGSGEYQQPVGRFPANLIHDGSDEVIALFPDSKGQQGRSTDSQRSQNNTYGTPSDNGKVYEPRGDSGSAARFFYCAKASKRDRRGSKHETVKPVALMRYLCRLVTPPGGVVLDPFAGSGTTGEAALLEGFRSLLIEKEPKYVSDINRRMAEVASELWPDVSGLTEDEGVFG